MTFVEIDFEGGRDSLVVKVSDRGWHVMISTTVTLRTVRNQLHQRYLHVTCLVACNPSTSSHCRLQRQRCQARAHWRTEGKSVVFSDESRFCLGASDDRELVRKSPGECLQTNCLWPRHTEPTPKVMV
ncbi:transposable element Tc1 transposase [Trichonephila clavipes]|nr:transposable element Tc1 transposase [Trichonephila clavipes]